MAREEIKQVKMTNQEAIEILRDTPIDLRSPREDDIHTLYAKAQMMAIEALERQIPKKTITVDWAEEFEGALIEDKCPICGNYVHCLENFCTCCGQAIDWSEEND